MCEFETNLRTKSVRGERNGNGTNGVTLVEGRRLLKHPISTVYTDRGRSTGVLQILLSLSPRRVALPLLV